MMNGLLGKKVGMTQVFSEKGDLVPVTVVSVGRCVPVLNRTPEKDGYSAVLMAYGERKEKHLNKPMKGFYDKYKVEPAQCLTEFRDESVEEDQLGKPLSVDLFAEGDKVSVVGVSKGKGFAGVFRRYNFRGAPASRGTHEAFRGGGSVGMHTYPGRVHKGKKMAGRMGNRKVHVKNLVVFGVDKDKSVILIRGALPGANGTLVRILKPRGQKG